MSSNSNQHAEINWRGEAFENAIEEATVRKLDRAALEVVDHLVEKVSAVWSGPGGKRASSPPGSPPGLVTGHLRRNVNFDAPSKFERRVGTGIGKAESVGYAIFLEFGTTHIEPRPWLLPGLREMKDRIVAILTGD